MKCKKHPKYTGKRFPKAACAKCLDIYELKMVNLRTRAECEIARARRAWVNLR